MYVRMKQRSKRKEEREREREIERESKDYRKIRQRTNKYVGNERMEKMKN